MRQKNTDLKDVWQTPNELLDLITEYERIDLDPCAGKNTEIGGTNYKSNGLIREWFGIVFVNPPFSEKKEWLRKAVKESKRDEVDCIYFVTPDSTDTKSWYHQFIAENADYKWFSKGRINYISPEGFEPLPSKNAETDSVTFGTCISIFGKPDNGVLLNLIENGDLNQSVTVKEVIKKMKKAEKE